jgi:WD40 repeat protein
VSEVRAPSSPYKGLAAFEDSAVDALFFFGRDRDSQVIAANLMASRVTVLFGPTGVGKTSVLRAGVAYKLRQEAGVDVRVHSSWIGDPGAALADLAPDTTRDLYLMLDQFEEFFLYHESDRSFVEELARVIRRPDLRVNVLIGIREDALALLDTFKAVIPNLLSNRLRLENLDRAAGEAAIRGPIAVYNERIDPAGHIAIEPELVETVLDEVAVGRVQLGASGRGAVGNGRFADRIEAPFLQLVLERLWEAEREEGSGELRLETLRRLGGASSIVRDHLDRAMSGLSAGEQEAAAAMYHHLVTPSGTKIAHGIRDLAGYADVDEHEAASVLDKLARERIVRGGLGEGPTHARYEIFHDVLADAVLSWRTRHQSEQALRVAERRRKRALVLAISSLVTLALVAALAVFAFLERSHARTHERAARAGELAAQANVQLGVDPGRALDLSLRAARLDDSPAVQSALRDALLASRVRRVLRLPSPLLAVGHSGGFALGDARGRVYRGFEPVMQLESPVTSIALSGDRIAAGTQSGSIVVLGTIRTSLHQQGMVTAVGLSRAAIAAGSEDGSVRLWHFPGTLVSLSRVRGRVTSLTFSPDGKFLLVTSHDRRARVLDSSTGKQVITLAQRGFINAAAFSPDGRRIATASQDHNARIWDARTGRALHTLLGAKGGLTAIAFSPDGKLLAVASSDGVARVYSASSGMRQYFLIGHVNAVTDVAFSPDGKSVATASSDTTARVWTSTIGQALTILHGNSPIVTRVFFPTPDQLITLGADSIVRVWDAGTAPDLKVLVRQRVPFVSAVRRRREIDLLDADGVVHVLDPQARTVIAVRSGAIGAQGNGKVVARLGPLLARASGDAITIFRDGRQIQQLRDKSTLPALEAASIGALKFSPDGTLIASVGDDHYLRVWEVSTGHKLYAVVAHQGPVPDFSFSPDGRWIATAGTISVKVWDARSGGQLLLLLGPTKPVQTVLFTADGHSIVAAGNDGTIRTYSCLVCGTLPELVGAGEARLAQTAFR